jgi:hypothetical protein
MARPIKYCKIEGCDTRCVGRGWCSRHYYAWKRTGDPLGRIKYKSATGLCEVEGCARPHCTQGLCNTHYAALRRNGDLVKRRSGAPRRPGHVVVNFEGRRALYAPEHVLARKSGLVAEHQLVLFDAIGLGPHRCHWCDEWTNWGWPMRHKLTVDHVNWDPTNNAIENLVPACHPCNSKRHRQPQAPPAGSPSVSAQPLVVDAVADAAHRK